MKIHIICGPFYPQLHPRAFRYTELMREFVRNGHEVTITNYTTIDNFDYDTFALQEGIKKINRLGFYHKHSSGEGSVASNAKYPKLFKYRYFLTEYFLGGSTPYKSLLLSKRLNIDKDTDIIIAGSTPFVSILGTSYYLRKNHFKTTTVFIADSGDPYYYSKQDRRGPWFKWIEKKAYTYYDYLTIPVETAIQCYNKIIPEEKIRIIPQGFNMRNLNLYKGEFSGPVKFAYSGVFYMNIRNPEFLFSFLDKQEIDFEFHLYMRYQEQAFIDMLNKYPRLKAKTFIVNSLAREDLLYELSRMDFLINISNLSNTQLPSKLIDYGIVNKPIYDCNEDNFNSSKLIDYLHKKFHDSMHIDVQKYNIEKVAKQFLDLHEEKRRNL